MSAILFTGNIHSEYFDTILKQASYVKEDVLKVACIWEHEKEEYIQALKNHHFVIVKSTLRDQEFHVPQFIPIVDGLEFLQENYPEIKFVLRTRFDITSNDYGKYVELIRDQNIHKITVICGIKTNEVYFLDIIVGGRLSEMTAFYRRQPRSDSAYPEKFLLENYSKKKKIFDENDLREILQFSFELCKNHSIEFTWYRDWDSTFWTKPHVKVIQEYCGNDSIIWT